MKFILILMALFFAISSSADYRGNFGLRETWNCRAPMGTTIESIGFGQDSIYKVAYTNAIADCAQKITEGEDSVAIESFIACAEVVNCQEYDPDQD